MLIMVESNEGADRERKLREAAEERGETRIDPSNLRAIARLEKLFPKLQKAPLTCGDINVILDGGGLLAIERKRAGDFLGSVGNGRIFRQVENMAANSTWHCIIIEGLISFDADDMAVIPTFDKHDRVEGHETTGWRGVSIRGAMYAIQWSGCPILTVDPVNLPYIVADIIKFCSKPTEHTQSLGRKRYVTFPPMEVSEEILSAFPKIGPKLVRSLKAFAQNNNDTNTPTLAEMLCWGSYLSKIHKKSRPEGWGDMIVTNFRGMLGLQEGEYLSIVRDEEEQSTNGKKKGSKNGKR
jgi:hypothetical protein